MNGKCPFCKLPVDIFDAVWDPRKRRYFHSACVQVMLATRLEELQRKIQRQTLTMEEALEVDELTLELNGMKEIENQLQSKDLQILRSALTSTVPVFSKKDPRYIDVDAVSMRLRGTTAIVKVRSE